MSAAARPSAEVLIPHNTGREQLRLTLDSLRAQSVEAAICVIDNGSADGTREMLAAEYPEVRLVSLGENRGFGVAINRGARSSDADVVILLNNDTEADPRFVEKLLVAVEAHGVAAGCLRLPDGTIDTAGVEADRSLIAYDHRHGESYPPAAALAPPLGPSGGAAAYDRETMLAVGGFDEGFFAYLEDVDLALRLRLAGVGCAAAPEAFAWHRHAGTLGAGSAAKNRLLGAGRGRLVWKYGRGIPLGARLRGFAIDAITYTGQIALDRNAGAIRGRIGEWRRHRGEPRPAEGNLGALPLLEHGTIESLRQRFARGRRYRRAAES